jgi:hypothetical protein
MSAPVAGVQDDAVVVRRADWRYLLPDPWLGRVAYPEPRDERLVEALELVSDEVECPAITDLEGFDLVVLTGDDRRALDAAADRVPAGAWIYAEGSGQAAASLARALRRRGFEDVAAHWLWPDAERCKEIVPLQPTALRHALGRRDPGARLRVRARVAGALARTPLFRLVVKQAAVIAKVPA